MKTEYKVLKDGKLWSDRFNEDYQAEEHKQEQEKLYPMNEFTVEKMTKEDFFKY